MKEAIWSPQNRRVWFSVFILNFLWGKKREENRQFHTERFHSKGKVPLTCIKTHNTESYNINRPQQQHFFTCLVTTQTPQRSKLLLLPQPSISARSNGCHITPSCSTHGHLWSKLESACYPALATAAPPSSFPWVFRKLGTRRQFLEDPWRILTHGTLQKHMVLNTRMCRSQDKSDHEPSEQQSLQPPS